VNAFDTTRIEEVENILQIRNLYTHQNGIVDDSFRKRSKAFITKGLSSGRLKPVIARTFRLEQIQEATRFLESNAQIGKVVVNV
jgi:NADPH:quinone reductase-like Zn-dependent oxidoreductase